MLTLTLDSTAILTLTHSYILQTQTITINNILLAGWPGFARYSCSIIIHVISDSFSTLWICDPQTPPPCSLGSRWVNCLAYARSQMNMHACAKFSTNLSSAWFRSIPRFVNVPPTPPPKCPMVVVGLIVYVGTIPRSIHIIYIYVCAKLGNAQPSRLAACSWQTDTQNLS